jgi:hypothetical protein
MTNKRSVKSFLRKHPLFCALTIRREGGLAWLQDHEQVSAKLRLSRGSRVALICDVTPQISRSR